MSGRIKYIWQNDGELKEFLIQELCKTSSAITLSLRQIRLIEILSYYFTRSSKFYDCKEVKYPSFDKGIWLQGRTVFDKSLIMHLFAINPINCYIVLPCIKAIYEYEMFGLNDIKWMKQNIKSPLHQNEFGNNQLALCFDDLGREINKYNSKLFFQELFFSRLQNIKPNNLTHLTTNYTELELEQKYGHKMVFCLRLLMNRIEF